MVDLSDKGSSESEDMNSHTPDRVSSEGNKIKTCADCGTTKTPLWRGGPAGPKSLCNACGIRSRKKRRAILGVNNKEDKKPKKTSTTTTTIGNIQNQKPSSSNNGNKLGDSVKRKLFSIGREMVLQRPRSRSTSSAAMVNQRRKLGEEEQAAFLLMALSCGSVYA
ncbi:unnamed protein product [Ilex paraguariensis]|uniref:GATA-type domain-containing protein n=1 Tax=Ilex paraguariensis TaxID=185542 RepID=A0ABC8RKX2_9AQUA